MKGVPTRIRRARRLACGGTPFFNERGWQKNWGDMGGAAGRDAGERGDCFLISTFESTLDIPWSPNSRCACFTRVYLSCGVARAGAFQVLWRD